MLELVESNKLRELEVTVSSIYWTLITLFPYLMLTDVPPTSEPSVAAVFMELPLKVDLALHAAPVIALTLDFFLFEKRYTRYQVTHVAPLTSILFGLWYVIWVEYCASHNGRCTLSASCLLPPSVIDYSRSPIPVLGIPILYPRPGLHWGSVPSHLFLPNSQFPSPVSSCVCVFQSLFGRVYCFEGSGCTHCIQSRYIAVH